jgi:energy-converting hydrogenase Eha subunit A
VGAVRELGVAAELGLGCDRPNGRSISAWRILPTPVVVATVRAETGEIIGATIIGFG